MNIFNKIVIDQTKKEITLGTPLMDEMAISRRQSHFAALRDGDGFRQPKASPKTDAQGLTRGKRKRLARLKAFFPDQYEKAMAQIRSLNEESA